jgi:hypothetical protein
LLLFSLLFLYLVLLSQFATAYYTLNAEPPDRALVVCQYFVTLTVGLWGFLSGSLIKQMTRHKQVLMKPVIVIGTVLFILLVCFGPLYASAKIYTMIAPARERAIEWDERDRVIRQAIAAGERHIVVWYIRDLTRLGDYSSDPQFLVNRAAADYYGVDTIIALDQKPEP